MAEFINSSPYLPYYQLFLVAVQYGVLYLLLKDGGGELEEVTEEAPILAGPVVLEDPPVNGFQYNEEAGAWLNTKYVVD